MTILVCLVMIVAMIFAIWKPPVAFAAVACMFVFEQFAQAHSSFFVSHSQLINYFVGVTVLLAIASQIMRHGGQLAPFPLGWFLVMLFFGYAFSSIYWSVYPAATAVVNRHNLPYVLVVIGLVPFVFSTVNDYRVALRTFIVAGAVLAVFLLLTTSVQSRSVEFAGTLVDRAGVERGGGGPLAVATFGGSLALATLLYRFKNLSRFWSIARFVPAILGVLLVFRSDSRGQVVALGLSFLAFVFARWPRLDVKNVAGAFMTLVVVVIGFAWSAHHYGTARWASERMASGSQHRLGMCIRLLEAWGSASPGHVLFGLGTSASWDPSINGAYPHVLVVETIGELGVVGICMLMLTVGLVGWSILRLLWSTKNDPEGRAIVATLGAFFSFFFIISFKQGSLMGHTSLFMTAILLFRLEVIYSREAVAERRRLSTYLRNQWLRSNLRSAAVLPARRPVH